MIVLPVTTGGWACLLADPAWRFSDKNTRGAAERHYPTMSGEEIAAMPVREVAAEDAVLAMWAPDTHVPLALAVASAWGFTYRHLYPWTKFKDPPPEVEALLPLALRGAWRIVSRKPQMGLGHYMRKVHEVALICTRGRPEILDHGVPSACLAPRTRHSQKPVDLHVALERFCAGPRLELFARATRPGWTSWGNEVSAARPHQAGAVAVGGCAAAGGGR